MKRRKYLELESWQGFKNIFLTCKNPSNYKSLKNSRLAMSLTYGYSAFLENPENESYVLYTQNNGWRLLEDLLKMTDDDFERMCD